MYLCAPVGDEGAYVRVSNGSTCNNAFTTGDTYTYTHSGTPATPGDPLVPGTDYWVRVGGKGDRSVWHYIRTPAPKVQVSNIDQTFDEGVQRLRRMGTIDYATAFTTGSNRGGYALSDVEIPFASATCRG